MDLTTEVLNEYLDKNNLSKDFTIQKMGKDLNKSRTLFFLEVKNLTVHNPSQMVMHYRLEKAKPMLHTAKHISEVAYKVGFDSTAYFSKCFKQTFKMSPSQYINSERT